MSLPDDWRSWGGASFDERDPAGAATTAYWLPKHQESRAWLVRNYLMAAFPEAKVFGKWDKKSVEEWESYFPENPVIVNANSEFSGLLNKWRVTLALPAIGKTNEGGTWSTAKPLQCWAARTATFMVGENDVQGWLLPNTKPFRGSSEVADGLWSIRSDWTPGDLWLAGWMRVSDPETFIQRARMIASDQSLWQSIVDAQRTLLERRWDLHEIENTVEQKLGLQS